MTFSKKLIISGNVFVLITMLILHGSSLLNELNSTEKQVLYVTAFFFWILAVVASIRLMTQLLKSKLLTKSERIKRKRKKVLATQLDLALNRKELAVAYQPIISANSETYGLEALIRWNSEALGNISPVEFIPIAEENDVIEDLTVFVLKDAAATITEFKELAYISVNISSVLLNKEGWLIGELDAVVEEFGFEPSCLALEFTERLSIKESHRSQLLELQERGYKLMIDDFGTGYSAIGYLFDFPVEGIKLDHSFISQFENPQFRNTIGLMVKMAKSLDLYVVAEGIETANQAKFVKEIGCDWLQGYLESPPMDKKKLTSYILNKRSFYNGRENLPGTLVRG